MKQNELSILAYSIAVTSKTKEILSNTCNLIIQFTIQKVHHNKHIIDN